MTDQLSQWQGAFGDAYTGRNLLETNSAVPYFIDALQSLERYCAEQGSPGIRSVLEVGCNLGGKLASMLKAWAQFRPETTLASLTNGDVRIIGIEPNEKARAAAWQLPFVSAMSGSAYQLPFADGEFDLAFTSGVLIHLPPDKIAAAMSEIHRVSRRGILAIEYYSPTEENCGVYQGIPDMMWNRNYGQMYLDAFNDLRLIKSGPYREWYIPNCKLWLLGKGTP